MSSVVGKPAPSFKLTAVDNGQFREISLGDYKGKWLLLFFYPLDFTFVCPTEITAFSDCLGSRLMIFGPLQIVLIGLWIALDHVWTS